MRGFLKACLLATALGGAGPVLAQAAVSAAVAPMTLTAAPDGLSVRRGDATMRIVALTDAILRVRIDQDGRMPEDASWAVSPAMRARSVRVQPMTDGFATATLRVRIDPVTGGMTVLDKAGAVIVADAARPMTRDGAGFTLRKAMPQSEHYFGLGDKTGGLDRRGQDFVNWNTDAYGFTSSTDPIYKSIPFYLGVGGAGGSYGLFLDNTYRATFDFGRREADVVAFGAPDGPIDYYIVQGPATADVVRRYGELTGRSPLMPMWALGYQQSRYSYMNEAELRAVAARLRAEKVPADVLWLDIDFQDRNRPFTVDRKAFPDLKGLIRDLGKDGFKVVTITDLHIANAPDQGYAPYDSGIAGNRFVHNPDGSNYVAPVWPGPSLFPDFTNAKVRGWWGGLFRQQVADGVAGAWNDMNEPAVFGTPTKTMPDDVVHRIAANDFAPRTATHAEIHNVYGMENTRATYEGLRALRPDERAFVMTRASYAGGQRYAVTWTGDNLATWDHLKLSVQQIINMGLSGLAYGAADVGGFAGGPSADLLTRWFQIGSFYPVFRDHAAKDTPRAEPWVDGPDHLAIRRRFVEERYRLMPYLYGLADRNARTGDPILRPVFYDYPDAMRMSCDQSMTFTLGKALLVAPPPNPEQPRAYDVCLPAGGWYDYWTGKRAGVAETAAGAIQSATQATGAAVTRGDIVRETPRIDHLPVYVRAGSILPRQAVVQSTAETPRGPLQLDVYPGADCAGVLYADDGHSMAFEKGGFARQTVRCVQTPDGLEIAFDAREGRYAPWWREIAVTVHDWTGTGRVTMAGKALPAKLDGGAGTIRFALSAPRNARTIRLTRN